MRFSKALLFGVFFFFLLSASGALAQKEWTFMVYLDADNNLEDCGIDDFNEMEVVGSTSQINIVVQMDRIPGYDNSNGDWTGTRRYYVTQDANTSIINSTMLQDMGEQNMGDPNVLKDFINWAMTNYPANRYCLVLWDHGSGWHKSPNGFFFDQQSKSVDRNENFNPLFSQAVFRKTAGSSVSSSTGFPVDPPSGRFDGFKLCCCDDTDGDRLYNDEIQQVLNQIPNLDILGFDACLMNMVETAYEMRGQANFLVGSEESEQGDGWPYDAILQVLAATPTMTTAKLCSTMVQKYGQFCDAHTMYDQTQSAIDLAQISALKDRINEFAQAMIAGSSWTQIRTAANSSDHSNAGGGYASHRDIYHFAHLVGTSVSDPDIITAANNVKSAVNAAVISNYHRSEHPNFHGLSIYLPLSSSGYNYSYAQGSNIDFPTDTQWDEFLFQLFAGGTPTTDTYEPNNFSSQAYGPLTSGTAYQSYLPDSNDVDWYLLSFGTTSNISVSLVVPGSADFDLYLLDTSLNVLCKSIKLAGEDESIDTSGISAGSYYVKVKPYHCFSTDPYTLTATFVGGDLGSVIVSYDDGNPYGGGYMTDFGDALCVAFTPPTVPMKLKKIFWNFQYLDGTGGGGDGSFFLLLMDNLGFMIDPDSAFLTPPDTGWCYFDVSDYNLVVHGDFYAGLIYDGFDAPCIGYDTTFSEKSFMYVAADEQWYYLGWTLFIRVLVSYMGTEVPGEEITEQMPKTPEISQNYPNPFNPETKIRFRVQGLEFRGQIPTTLQIYNILGQKVKTLVNEPKRAGNYEVVWDGKDDQGKEVASGIYFYQLKAGDFTETKKMILLK
jgi:hypothetical protein